MNAFTLTLLAAV